METIIIWWCGLIGVTSASAIHVAVGIMAAVTFVVAVIIALLIIAVVWMYLYILTM